MNKYQVGDLVKHAARKTVVFQIVSVEGRAYKVKRTKNGAIDNRYKGYKVPFSHEKHLVKVGAGKVESKPAVALVTIDDLQNNPFISTNIVSEFMRLVNEFSPENLSCDGELSASQVQKKRAELNRKWDLLEQYVGQKVDKF